MEISFGSRNKHLAQNRGIEVVDRLAMFPTLQRRTATRRAAQSRLRRWKVGIGGNCVGTAARVNETPRQDL